MQQREPSFSLKKAGCCALMLAAAVLGGCDNGGAGGGSSASVAKTAKLSGRVLNINGPVTAGTVDVTDAKGANVASASFSGGENRYSITVPATAAYPIVLTAKPQDGGTPVKAVVTSSLAEHTDITTVSTLIVDAALQLGGLTPQNIAMASAGAINQRQSTGASAGSGGSTGGPGNSGGGLGRGGHGGHDMAAHGGSDSANNDANADNNAGGHNMSH